MKRIQSAFYIYSNLSLAVFLIIGAMIEILCGISVDPFMAMYIAYPAAGLFSVISLCIIWSVIRDERKYA